MIVACPKCHTRYNIPAGHLGHVGRQMLCAKCDEQWFQPAPPGAKPADKQAPLAPESSPLKSVKRRISFIGIIFILLLGMGLGSGVLWMLSSDVRNTAGFVPVTMRSDGKGSRVELNSGMVLSDIEKEVIKDGDLDILLFYGKVTNKNKTTAEIPEIRVQLLDERDVELDFWPAETPVDELPAEGTTSWVVRFVDPPLDKIAKYKAFFAEF